MPVRVSKGARGAAIARRRRANRMPRRHPVLRCSCQRAQGRCDRRVLGCARRGAVRRRRARKVLLSPPESDICLYAAGDKLGMMEVSLRRGGRARRRPGPATPADGRCAGGVAKRGGCRQLRNGGERAEAALLARNGSAVSTLAFWGWSNAKTICGCCRGVSSDAYQL